MRRIFGERIVGTSHDVLKLAIEAKSRGTLPKLWIDCGTENYLIHGTRALHDALTAAEIPHAYHEFTGSHGWDYCNAHLEEALAFHAANSAVSSSQSRRG